MVGLPLEGVRVVDMTVVWAGSYTTMFLADLGAEVIRVESLTTLIPVTRGLKAHPTEADLRNSIPMIGGMPDRKPGARPWNRFPVFNAHARNKLSMTAEVSRPEGLDILERLVQISDVFVENNATGTMGKLGISYDMLREIRPDIVMLRMPAFGNTGPYANYRALGQHVEGVVGHTLLRGYSDMDASANTHAYMADAAAGSQSAFAVLAALHYRRRTGKGQLIEMSQAESTLPFMGSFLMEYVMNGRSLTTIGNRHAHAIQGCYPCKGDDRWICITIFADGDWSAFCDALANPEWSRDERFADQAGRREHHDEIDSHIAEWTRRHDPREATRILQGAGVAAGPVMDHRDAFADPHLEERGVFEEVYQEDTGTHRYPGMPYKMSEAPLKIRRGPVRLGEDNEYLYKELLQVSDERYADLEREGHIGMDYDESVP